MIPVNCDTGPGIVDVGNEATTFFLSKTLNPFFQQIYCTRGTMRLNLQQRVLTTEVQVSNKHTLFTIAQKVKLKRHPENPVLASLVCISDHLASLADTVFIP